MRLVPDSWPKRLRQQALQRTDLVWRDVGQEKKVGHVWPHDVECTAYVALSVLTRSCFLPCRRKYDPLVLVLFVFTILDADADRLLACADREVLSGVVGGLQPEMKLGIRILAELIDLDQHGPIGRVEHCQRAAYAGIDPKLWPFPRIVFP